MPLTPSHLERRSAVVDENLRHALSGSGAAWIEAALRQAEADPLNAALDAAALASALAVRAARCLGEEMGRRDTEFLQEVLA